MLMRTRLIWFVQVALLSCSVCAPFSFGDDREAIYPFVARVSTVDDKGYPYSESFVVEVDNNALADKVRDLIAGKAKNLRPSFEIAVGGQGRSTENVDYDSPVKRKWGWRVVRLVALEDVSNVRIDFTDPRVGSLPSDIEKDPTGWIQKNGAVYMPMATFYSELVQGKNVRLENVSSRGFAGSGDRTLIVGFIIQGSEPKRVAVRGRGPSLAAFNVSGSLPDPMLRVYKDQAAIGFNDNWKDQNAAVIQSVDDWLKPLDPAEPLLILTLAPGAYTAHVTGANNQEGIAVLEVFDLN